MQNRDRFSVVELLMQGLSIGAFVLMAAVFTVYVGRAATRIPEIVGRQQIEQRRNDARSAGERAGLGEVDGERPRSNPPRSSLHPLGSKDLIRAGS